MEAESKPKTPAAAAPCVENGNINDNGQAPVVNGEEVEIMEVEYVSGGDGDKNEAPNNLNLDSSPSAAQPTPKRRKLDKAEREAERLRREEEKRIREQERLEKLRIKEEEKRRKEEDRLRKEEEKKRKDEEKEQERLKREEEKRLREEEKKRKDEEKRLREEEKKRKDEEKEQERLKREEEKRQRDEEKKRKDEEREQERLKKEEEKRKREEEKRKKEEERLKRELEKKQAQEKVEEEKQKQANFMSKFLHITPTSKKGTGLNVTPNSALGTTKEGPSAGEPSSKTPEVIDLENETPRTMTGKNLLARFNSSADLTFSPMPFQVKMGMALAPTVRKVLTSEQRSQLDQALRAGLSAQTEAAATATGDSYKMDVDADADEPLVSTSPTPNYLKELKFRPSGKSGKTLVKRNATVNQEDEIEVLYNKSVTEATETETAEAPVTDPPLLENHFKLLQFTENRRPAYWGTWKTKPKKVAARRPFSHEEDIDYDFDSDDEWEDEPEDAEELKSEKESDDEDGSALQNGDEDDDDGGWMVPHGYLSDDERADAEISGDKKMKIEKDKEGGGEIKVCDKVDKDEFKKQEEQYYKEIKQDKKLVLPFIQTENLSAYRMVLFKKKKERRLVKRNAATPFYAKLKEAKEGRLALASLYDGFPSSDDEDGDWEESSDEDDEVSSDEDSDKYVSEDDFLAEIGVNVNNNKDKSKNASASVSAEVMDTS